MPSWSRVTDVLLYRIAISKRSGADATCYNYSSICPVCMDALGDEQLLVRLACRHSMHFVCFRQMTLALAAEASVVKCPTCRSEHAIRESPQSPTESAASETTDSAAPVSSSIARYLAGNMLAGLFRATQSPAAAETEAAEDTMFGEIVINGNLPYPGLAATPALALAATLDSEILSQNIFTVLEQQMAHHASDAGQLEPRYAMRPPQTTFVMSRGPPPPPPPPLR